MFGRKKKRNALAHDAVCAIIPAAGSSTRMGGENKLLQEIGEIPVLVRTVMAFDSSPLIRDIVLVCREQDIVPYSHLVQTYGFAKVRAIIRGGATRAQSVLEGVKAVPEDTAVVAIHDGARPLVSAEIIQNTVTAALQSGAAAPVVAMKDSVKRVENGTIVQDVPRDTIAAVQTPQCFERTLIQNALTHCLSCGIALTDDCSAVEQTGHAVQAVEGSYRNIKITTPEDLRIAEAFLEDTL
jgi:2-C-methyl-D-erythritol 4-phosphate cytidylyltransferase